MRTMRALVLVDLQNDFCPGGALAVPHGNEIIAVANRLMPAWDLVVATQDWHPPDHCSFASNHPGHGPGEVITVGGLPQVLWPVHAVQGSPGAALHPALNSQGVHYLLRKGTDPAIDSYSAFFDNGRRRSTGLAPWLQQRGVSELGVMGLATDYCVRFTALDALCLGFAVTVIADGCRAVDLQPGDGDAALEAMRQAGCRICSSSTA